MEVNEIKLKTIEEEFVYRGKKIKKFFFSHDKYPTIKEIPKFEYVSFLNDKGEIIDNTMSEWHDLETAYLAHIRKKKLIQINENN